MTTDIANLNEINQFPTQRQQNVRDFGVEILRIIAIFLICLSHSIQTSEQFLNYNNLTFGIVVLKILRYSGQVGNVLFVICSSWFLLDSKGVKFEKLLKILLDSMMISTIIFLIFACIGQQFSIKDVFYYVFPDIYYTLWFIPTYALFYLIHPLLNSAINGMNQKTHFTFCLILFGFFGVLGFFGFYLSSILLNYFLGFCVIYFVVAFEKKYCKTFYENKKLNLILFFSLFLLFVLLILAKNFLQLESLTIDQFFSPLLIPMLLILFNLFYGIKIKNKVINYFASCSLFVYCIHENILMRNVRADYYNYVLSINFDMYFAWIMLCAIVNFLGGYILSILYKQTLSKLTNKLSKIFAKWLCCLRDKIYKIFFKENNNLE